MIVAGGVTLWRSLLLPHSTVVYTTIQPHTDPTQVGYKQIYTDSFSTVAGEEDFCRKGWSFRYCRQWSWFSKKDPLSGWTLLGPKEQNNTQPMIQIKLGVFFEISCLLNCTRIQRKRVNSQTNLFQRSATFDINKSDSKKEDKTTKITYQARQKSS